MVENLPANAEFYPWIGKTPQKRAWQPIPVFSSVEFHRQRSLANYSLWGGRVGHDGSDFAGVIHAPIKGWTGDEICVKMASHPSDPSTRPSGGATLLGQPRRKL